jgi:hypothetical protein
MKQDYKYFIKNNGWCQEYVRGCDFCEKECIFKNGNNCKYDVKYRYKYAKLYLKIKLLINLI